MGVPGGKEKEQGIENLVKKKMMENFPNLVTEIDILYKSWKHTESKQDEPKEAHTKTHHN